MDLVVFKSFLGKFYLWYNKNRLLGLFFLFMTAFLLIDIGFAIGTGGKTFIYSFLGDKHDIFMDYFNSVKDAYDHPYSHKVLYPPLAVCIFNILAQFSVPNTIIYDPDFSIGFNMRETQFPMLLFTIIMMLIFLAYFCYLQKLTESKLSRRQFLILFTLLFLSFPVLYGLERGNCIFVAILFSFLYLYCYNSENRYIRILSYVFLGIAAGIKVLPAVFGILTFKRRGLKEFIICIITVAVIFFFPFIFTDGDISTILNNIWSYLGKVAGRDGLINLEDYLALIGLDLTSIVIILAAVLGMSVILLVLDKQLKMWEELLFISILVIVCFSVTTPYLFCYILIPAYYFFMEEKELNRVNLVYMFGIVLVFAMFPVLSQSDMTLIPSLKAVIVFVLFGWTLARIILHIAVRYLSEDTISRCRDVQNRVLDRLKSLTVFDHLKCVLFRYFGNNDHQNDARDEGTSTNNEQPIENIFCGKCGAVNPKNNRYCGSCGSLLYKPLDKPDDEGAEIPVNGVYLMCREESEDWQAPTETDQACPEGESTQGNESGNNE